MHWIRSTRVALAAAAVAASPFVLQAQSSQPVQSSQPAQSSGASQTGRSTRSTSVPARADAPGILQSPCLEFGVAVGAPELFIDPAYAAVVRDWASIGTFTLESEHKFSAIRFGPGSGDYDFTTADQVIDELRTYGFGRHGMAFHTLFWHNRAQLDPWVETLDQQGARRVIREHVQAVYQHCFAQPGAFPIDRIDLVNEPLADYWILRPPGTLPTQNPWAAAGTAAAGYVDWLVFAFQEAQAVFPPDAKLFFNDYGISFGPIDTNPANAYDPTGATHRSKADAAYKLVRDHLVPAGLDGVGIQTHFTIPYYQDVSSLRSIIRLYGDLGVEVHLSELDVAIDTGGVPPTQAQLQQQAALYETVLRICAEEPACTQVTVWGVTDQYSWIPMNAPHCPGCVDPLPHDDFGQPKPAYFAIEALFQTLQRACPR